MFHSFYQITRVNEEVVQTQQLCRLYESLDILRITYKLYLCGPKRMIVSLLTGVYHIPYSVYGICFFHFIGAGYS